MSTPRLAGLLALLAAGSAMGQGSSIAINNRPLPGKLSYGNLPICPLHTPCGYRGTRPGWRAEQRKRRFKELAYRQRRNRRLARAV